MPEAPDLSVLERLRARGVSSVIIEFGISTTVCATRDERCWLNQASTPATALLLLEETLRQADRRVAAPGVLR